MEFSSGILAVNRCYLQPFFLLRKENEAGIVFIAANIFNGSIDLDALQ